MPSGIPLLLTAMLAGAPPGTPAQKATHAVELTDAAGDVDARKAAFDVVALALRSDGTHLTVAATLKEALAGVQGEGVVKLRLDTDNNGATGFEGGFEYDGELRACAEFDAPPGGRGASVCLGTMEGKLTRHFAIAGLNRLKQHGKDRIRWLANAERTPMQGKTVDIAYADMGVKPGQTIRIAASEWHAAEGAFPEVALTLK